MVATQLCKLISIYLRVAFGVVIFISRIGVAGVHPSCFFAVLHEVGELPPRALHDAVVVSAEVVLPARHEPLAGVGGAVGAGDDGHLLDALALGGVVDPENKKKEKRVHR